ncbi:MAG: glucosidase [Planctomycetes bacterium]|nr:glucosidase [Planctomycetota bacterium]
MPIPRNAEQRRLEEHRLKHANWRKWGPYLSERQWGTVREDYSANGDAWNFFPHDDARSRAYRWGEDGLAGLCDEDQNLCLSLVLWNGQDPILKERLFGLINSEGNHGEDVKELYYYLDAAPSHAYLKMLYKYPQRAYPYDHIVAENGRRRIDEPEYEVIDTGIFDDDRYFDVFVEYAKAGPNEIVGQITAHNRGPDAAEIHLLPQVWYRDTWSWKSGAEKPIIRAMGPALLSLQKPGWEDFFLTFDGNPELLFCENATNLRRHGTDPRAPGYFKDAFHEYLLKGKKDAVNPSKTGTKAGALYQLNVPAGGSVTVTFRLAPATGTNPASNDQILENRLEETNEFYGDLQHGIATADARNVQRQAFAGLIWSKQFYYYDIPHWLMGDPGKSPPPKHRLAGRNRDWLHLNNADIISMPDKWEYPWYAAWDLAFHMIPFALIDPEFAKSQLLLMTREWYMHPNGQLPAYEWNFSDVNPPVHAWATWRVFQIDRRKRGDAGDLEFLERVFHKLMLNFTWWVNRKDAQGRNVFQGGFLGLDNIGVFDRSSPLPMGGFINQADGTAWMAMYCLNLMRIALELALHNRVYEDIATKFFEHFLHIAEAMTNIGCELGEGDQEVCGVGLWDEEDQFFYDELNLPDGQLHSLKVRSMVGLIPLYAIETLEPEMLAKLPDFKARLEWFLNYRPDLASLVSHWHEPGIGDRRLLSLLRGSRMKKLLKRMLDETEFLSEHGVRSLSKIHHDHPYTFHCSSRELRVEYQPAESRSRMFGGNSNWRGPIWFPVNYLIVESLQKFDHYYGWEFRVECPTGSGQFLSLVEIADELAKRLTRLFLRDNHGRRPIFGTNEKFQNDPHFRDYLPFPEYFDGDTGHHLGAAHQTGWTALVAKLLMPRRADPVSEPCPVVTKTTIAD